MKIVLVNGKWCREIKTGTEFFQKYLERVVNWPLQYGPHLIGDVDGNTFTVFTMGNDPEFIDTGSLDNHFSLGIFKIRGSEDPLVVVYDVQDRRLADKAIADLEKFHPKNLIFLAPEHEITPEVLKRIKKKVREI